MIERFGIIFAFCVIIFAIGCGSSPVLPGKGGGQMLNERGDSGHVVWGRWELFIDQENGTAKVVPVRGAEAHVNVTLALNPPACADCIKVVPTKWNASTRIADITVTLKNPTKQTGYT